LSAAQAPRPQRIAELFDALVELEPAAAKQRLDTECADDPALHAAVMKLLMHDRAAERGFLESPAAVLVEALREQEAYQATLPAQSVDEESEAPAISSRLGRYYVLDQLGEGGMGMVYVGYDDTLDRRVALKILRRSEAARAWLLREGQALARLSHPNVVGVHEVGEHEGRMFLAMELVKGPTLRAWLDEKPRTFTEKLRLFMQAGRGLAAAHEASLVHRDFKPDNVIIGQDERARVVDFGIAALSATESISEQKALSGPASPVSILGDQLTRTGTLLGTPAYMSPEQFAGQRGTSASDQWSFCVAVYRAVYGTWPFAQGSFLQLADSVTRDTPLPPPHLPEVPVWLPPILLRGLQKDPTARFPSMVELLLAIEENLPADLELDPTRVIPERKLLTLIALLGLLIISVPMISNSVERLLSRPVRLIALPGIALFAMLATVAIKWKQLSQNRYGRRTAGLFSSVFATGFLQCLLAVLLDLPDRHILVEAMLLLAVYCGLTGILHEPWITWLGGFWAVIAVADAALPQYAAALFVIGMVGSVSAFLLRLFLDRHLTPQAALGIQRSTEQIRHPSRSTTP
jgi:serine/threonine-protein kinase